MSTRRRVQVPAKAHRGAVVGRGRRRGAASLDYVLVLGVVLPLAAALLWAGPLMMRSAYEMICVLVSWPFM
ncbi:MAG: hypothetical protein ACOY3P_01670 [Planctomycetota bacterium]